MGRSVEGVDPLDDNKGCSQSSERKKARRCVQSTLKLHSSKKLCLDDDDFVHDEDDVEEYTGNHREINKRKKANGTSKGSLKKVPSKLGMELDLIKQKKTLVVTSGSNFFTRLSERKLQRRQQKEQEIEYLEGCKKSTEDLIRDCEQKKADKDSDSEVGVVNDIAGKKQHNFEVVDMAKVANKENARFAVGRQLHPFFLLRKGKKIRQNTFEDISQVSQGCSDFSFSPVHIYENLQQENLPKFDWGKWIFCNESLLDTQEHADPEPMYSPLLQSGVQPSLVSTLVSNSNKPFPVKDCSHLKIDEFSSPHVSKPVMVYLREAHQELRYIKDYDMGNSLFLSEDDAPHIGDVFINKVMMERMLSYDKACGSQPSFSLWTNKYQPEQSLEVCGNTEPVRILSEWLQCWQQEVPQTPLTDRGKCSSHSSDCSEYENCSDSDDMSRESCLKNVLLLTGPIGSGKSAAIYACAKEHGFEVIEVSASDWRNGANVKLKFGEAMESHGFNKWVQEGHASPSKMCNQELSSIHPMRSTGIDLTGEDFSDISTSFTGQLKTGLESSEVVEIKGNFSEGVRKSLILFEDVDIIFEEDRGFISTLVQLAETAKRPMILTSNSKDPSLPHALDKLVVDFTLPSWKEMLSHVYMVLIAENINMSLELIERIIQFCQGDIRKTIMFLQFWYQGGDGETEKKRHGARNLFPFDLNTVHGVIPIVIPWEFPCQLSRFVEKEISKALTPEKERINIMNVVVEEQRDPREMLDDSSRNVHVSDDIRVKKADMFRGNCVTFDDSEPQACLSEYGGFSDKKDLHNKFGPQTVQQRSSTVLSSQSDYLVCDTAPETSGESQFLDHSGTSSDQSPTKIHQIDQKNVKVFDSVCETIDHVTTNRSLDISCVPDSSFVCETEFNNEEEGCPSRSLLEPIHSNREIASEGNHNAEISMIGPFEMDSEWVHGYEDSIYFHKENQATVMGGCQLMDECSRADFSAGFFSSINKTHKEADQLVKETWKKLRDHRDNLTSYICSQMKDVFEIVKFTSELTCLICEADLMICYCKFIFNEFPKIASIPYDEPESVSRCEKQLEMIFTFVENSLRYHEKNAATFRSKMEYGNAVDLGNEALTCSISSLAKEDLTHQSSFLEYPWRCDMPRWSPKCHSSSKSHIELQLDGIFQSIVPKKSYLTVNGVARHEYLAYLSQMAKSEASSALKNTNEIKQRRRDRNAKNTYLRISQPSLSQKDLHFLCRCCCFGE